MEDFRNGWSEQLKAAGNCPPHKCLFRTVISRHEKLVERLPLYERLLSEPDE